LSHKPVFNDNFSEVAALDGALNRITELNAKFSLDMNFESVAALCERPNLHFPA